MNPHHQPHKSQYVNYPGAHATPDWRPWMYQSFATSQNQDNLGLEQYHEPAPPYPDGGKSFHARNNNEYPEYGSALFPETNHFRTKPAVTERSAHQSQLNHYLEARPSEINTTRRLYSDNHDTSIASSYPSSTHSTPPPGDDAILSQALSFMQHSAAPAPSYASRLPRPIAIPQTMHGRGQSFLRAWAPYLQAYNISQADFLSFIDNLNIVSTANPPLQVLNLAGNFLGMVPHHWAQLAGAGIQASAQLGTAIVSKTRTDMYMKAVNEKMFKPRGLRVSITSAGAMRSILCIPDAHPFLAPLTRETMQMSTLERELLAVREYSAVLELDVPRPAEPTTVLAKLSAKQVEGLAKKNQKKAVKEREKAMEKEEKKAQREGKKRAEDERKGKKRAQKREKKHRKKVDEAAEDTENDESENFGVERDWKQEKPGKQSKEVRDAGKVQWIVIENL